MAICTASMRKWERSLNLSPGFYEAFLVRSLPSAAKMRCNPMEQTAKHLRIYHQSKFSARERCSSACLPKHQLFIIALLGEATSDILTSHMTPTYANGSPKCPEFIHVLSYRPSDRFISSMLLKPMAQERLFPRFFCILVQGCSKSLLEFSIASHFINQTDSEAPQLLQSIESISNTFALSLCACKGSMSLACGTHAHASLCSDGGAIKTSQFTWQVLNLLGTQDSLNGTVVTPCAYVFLIVATCCQCHILIISDIFWCLVPHIS